MHAYTTHSSLHTRTQISPTDNMIYYIAYMVKGTWTFTTCTHVRSHGGALAALSCHLQWFNAGRYRQAT